jgi:hypothetical protein
MFLALVTFSALSLTGIGVAAQSVQPTGDRYSWAGEFVDFDASSRIMTVASRAVGDATSALPRFKAGDRIVLTWSGFDTYADAIARAVSQDAAAKLNEPFKLPVEFVKYDASRQYLTFKAQVPPDSIDALKAMKAGEWITATARHRPTGAADALMTVHAYAAPARATTN